MSNKIGNTEKHNLLLSLSVFKKLYDEKKDIYEIIVLFIKSELSNFNLMEFTLIEMTHKINKEYNFDIPQAIIKTSLNKLKKSGDLELKSGQYRKLNDFKDIEIIDKDSDLARKEEREIVQIIKDSIEKNTLSDDKIKESLESYILKKNDTHNIFSYINRCIIKNSSNEQFIKGLNEIKYGLVLYEGISYGMETINPDKWNKKIIFLDTEILFYLGGYNGDLFKQMVDDFISLIRIVNKTKKIVTLKFSEDIKKEVEDLFYVAELIIERKTVPQPNDVVEHILKNCQNASDVVIEKVDFYSSLSKLGVTEYENKLNYNEETHKYNLEDTSNLEDASDVDEKIQKHKKQLSSINILRKNDQSATLDKVKYLLLTETRNTIELSIKYKINGDVNGFPLALSLFDLTNQLWIKINKGLGSSELPSTFDIRNKAKIALSSSLAKKVSEEFERVSNNYKDKIIDKNSLIEKISDLRKIDSNPDNINELNCEEISLLILDPDSMERHYEEKALYKQESEDKSNRIGKQDDKIKEKDNEIRSQSAELEEKSNEISKLKERDEARKIRKIRNKRTIKGFAGGFIVFLLFYFNDYLVLFMGKFIYIVGGLASIFSILNFVGIDWSKIKSWLKKQ